MKQVFRIFILILALGIFIHKTQAQIQNAISYFPTSHGVCGASSFTPSDSIYTAVLVVPPGPAYSFVWESSIDGASYTPISGTAATKENYLPSAVSTTTWFRRTVIQGIDTSHSNTIIFYANLPPIGGNTIIAKNSTIIPCGTSSYTVGQLYDNTPLTGGTGNNYYFTWLISTDGIHYSNAPTTTAYIRQYTPAAAITKSTWFKRVVYSNAKVCTDTSNAIAFTFGSLPGNTITPPSITSSCASSSFTPGTITGSTPSGTVTYQWQFSVDSIKYTNIPGATGQNLDPGTITVSTYYRRNAVSGLCSGNSNVVVLSVAPAFSSNTIGAAQTIDSANAPAALTGNTVTAGSNPITYLWQQSADTLTIVNASGTNNGINYQPPILTHSIYYRRLALSGTCSSASSWIFIKVNSKYVPPPPTCTGGGPSANLSVKIFNKPNPKATNSEYDYSVAITNFGPNPATNVLVKDTLPAILDYVSAYPTNGTVVYDPTSRVITWTVPSLANQGTEALIITVNPTVNDQIINSISISSSVCDPVLSNNVSRDTLNDPIPVLLTKDIPDIITPNGDGFNDLFVIQHFLGIQGLSNNELLIMDRWGNPVFDEKPYLNDWGAKGLSNGTYFYVLRINNGLRSQTFKGHITVLR